VSTEVAGPDRESQQVDLGTSLHEAVERRARELWEERGRVDGHADEDWVQAEREVTEAWNSKGRNKVAFMAVKFDDEIYTLEYEPSASDCYQPGDLQPGEKLEIRIEGDHMSVALPNGKDLNARILRKRSAL